MIKLRNLLESPVNNNSNLKLKDTWMSEKLNTFSHKVTAGGDWMAGIVIFQGSSRFMNKKNYKTVTDNQVIYTKGVKVAELMSRYPKGIAFILKGKWDIIAVLQGGIILPIGAQKAIPKSDHENLINKLLTSEKNFNCLFIKPN